MKSVSELRGLRFPDDYLVKMFFKEGLHRSRGRVLELGCGSGNNLMLFASFGWDVTGVDISAASLDDARFNLDGAGTLLECDLARDFPSFDAGTFDAVAMPSVNYYVPREAFVRLLIETRRVLRPGGMFYIRSRLPEDWRFGRGRAEGPGAFRLDTNVTGEFGLLNVFYSVDELCSLLDAHLGGLQAAQELRMTYENPQAGAVVRNADVVFWGRVGAA
jgi:SAM-dependent methyltransferase